MARVHAWSSRPAWPSRRRWLVRASAGAAGLACPALWAERPGPRARVLLGLTREDSLFHLPLVVARQLGYFTDEGLDVRLVGWGSTAAVARALRQGRIDVAAASYLQLIVQRLQDQPWQSFVLMGRSPMVAMGVSTAQLPQFDHVVQLRGQCIGVAAESLAARLLAQALLAKAGLSPAEVHWLELPAGAADLVAWDQGRIQALSHADPLMTQLERRGELRLLADARTLRGTEDVFDGPLPSTCLFAHRGYVKARAHIVQGLTQAVLRSLRWLQTAAPADLLAAVPATHTWADRALYLAAYFRVREGYSPDGILDDEAAHNAWRVVQGLEGVGLRPDVAARMASAHTNAFVLQARRVIGAPT
ncbi:ABC transporter substrate-binding protein [Caldimonas taiwanensis]|uniref:ABC transporter substrate-binding protein n=1 Tax=Caldimonas taiwanensis TaxID=307483 RepID=UPI000A025563|nr:ABC transporter substrate-binding protein [Caldimonas taiwanensis]